MAASVYGCCGSHLQRRDRWLRTGASAAARLLLAGRQLLAFAGVRRRNVDVQRLQRLATGVADLVAITAFDKQQGAGTQGMLLTVDDGHAFTRDDKQPLVSAAMAVVRPAFVVAGCERHLRRLGPIVAQHD